MDSTGQGQPSGTQSWPATEAIDAIETEHFTLLPMNRAASTLDLIPSNLRRIGLRFPPFPNGRGCFGLLTCHLSDLHSGLLPEVSQVWPLLALLVGWGIPICSSYFFLVYVKAFYSFRLSTSLFLFFQIFFFFYTLLLLLFELLSSLLSSYVFRCGVVAPQSFFLRP
ncbi:uncharacterized protein BO80DRAFT_6490 [Aspergillus ibericus CBS 121593]|uniref:Uncharacterized protein n=1 Tax=Aspergillus ibericus CBS 121593 TaxID=1448316 RepID=A0A395HEK5_9EURO|nr:hypothetical protein BO80DRAFT_6490 [Aspergillus ibericus CBS 121593]RAL06277.1 hypothetical protein BO80DRAFT_6490 [Aspergillus ibericus CBS 121593]